MTGIARYDEHADWYDAYITGPAKAHTRRTSAALCQAATPGSGLCLDLGCGTGIHAARLQALGYDVVGVDVSLDQLRHAGARLAVVAADAARLPLAPRTADLVVATLIHTDVEDWAQVVREVARVLRPGGRFIYVGVHPCFVGPFAQRDQDLVRLHPGYLSDGHTFDGPGVAGTGIRQRVGVHHRPLSAVINPVLQAGLTLLRLDEPADNSTPDLLVIEATA